MEMALAPIAGTRLLAPFRLSVVSMLANLTIEANRFETIMALLQWAPHLISRNHPTFHRRAEMASSNDAQGR